MSETKELLEKILKNLKKIDGIENAVIVSRNGIKIIPAEDDDTSSLVAMSATLLGSAEHMLACLEKGIPQRVIVENANCKLLAIGAGPKALLLVVANPRIVLGLLLFEADKTVKEIKEILE